MLKKISKHKKMALLNVALSSLVICAIGVSTFAYWSAPNADTNAIFNTNKYNATDDEFNYYAAIPNMFASDGYDYYNLNTIPNDLVCRVTGLAVVRYEALTDTAYIPSYPKVTIGGTKFNDGIDELPVIHILSGITSNDTSISNGYKKIKSLIIPSTVTYIQPGAFTGCTFENVSILSDGEAGYLKYSDTEFNKTPEFELKRDNTLYSITSDSTDLVTQFSDKRLEYDNLTHKYYSYVFAKDNKDGTTAITVTIDGKDVSIPKGAKYKIEYDKTNFTVTEYSYKLKYYKNKTDKEATEVDLYLNKNQTGYEEYNFGVNDPVISTSNYSTIVVDEYIGGTLNRSNRASFNLKYLKANYSEDNDNFSFKYAPNNIYESIHYYNDAGSTQLKSVKGQKRIGIEKAYYLNNVTSELELINGDKIVTISVPYKDEYAKGLYVEATCGSALYQDPETKQSTIAMKLENGVYTYTFAQSVIDKDELDGTTTLPTKDNLTFYAGKENVQYPVNYKDTSAEAIALNTGYRRVYFNPYTKNSTLTDNSDYNPATDQYRFHWYVVGWYKDDQGKDVESSYKMTFLDNKRTAWVVDIPNSIERFKLARMEGEKPLDTSNGWSKITNVSRSSGDDTDHWTQYGDYIITSGDYIYLNFKEWNKDDPSGKEFYISTITSPDTTITNSVAFKNNSYLTLSECKGNTKYVPLKENISYNYKDISKGMYEFSTYDEDNKITSIPVPEGTILSANANGVSCGYNLDKISIGFAESSETITGSKLDKYIESASGGIKFKLDCMIVPYIKTTGTNDFSWYIEIQSSELEGISSEITVDNSSKLTITPTIKNTTVGNTGSVNSPDFIPGKLTHIYVKDPYGLLNTNTGYAIFTNDTGETVVTSQQQQLKKSNISGTYVCEITDAIREINPNLVKFYTDSSKKDKAINVAIDLNGFESNISIEYSKYYLHYSDSTGKNWANLPLVFNPDTTQNPSQPFQSSITKYFESGISWGIQDVTDEKPWYSFDNVENQSVIGKDTDNNAKMTSAGKYTLHYKPNGNKIWIEANTSDELTTYWKDLSFTLTVGDSSTVYTFTRGANTMQNDAMQFYSTELTLTKGAIITFKCDGKEFSVGTDKNQTNIVQTNASGKLEAEENVSNVTVFLKAFPNGGFDSWFQDAKSPVLKINGTPTLLVRNNANTAYEEYIALGVDTGNYIVSPYFTYVSTDYFGNGSNLHYYGDKADSTNNLGYHTVGTAESVFTFVPNSINGVEEYVEVYDNNDRYLTTLHYSESESLSTGVHTFDGLFPYVPGEYSNITLYYKNGENKTTIYGGANVLEPSYLSQTLSNKITYPFDYYLDEISPDNAFVYDNGAYYMDSVKFNTSNTNHQIKYIDADGNKQSLTVNNSPYAYDKYQLNGFYLFTHESNDKEFAVSNSGSYDLMVYLINDTNCYVGHRTHVDTPNDIILRIVDSSDNIAAEYKMNSTASASLNRYDAFIKSGYKAEIVNENGVVVNAVNFESGDYDSYNRIFYSERTNESYHVKIDTIALHFTPGGLNKYRPIYDTSEIAYRYNPEPFRLRLSDTTCTSITPTVNGCSVNNMTYDPDTKTYCWETIVNSDNASVTISEATYTFKETGAYRLTYNNVDGIKANKLQKADTYYVSLDNNVIAKLDVEKSLNEAKFYEYKVDTVIFNEDVNLLAKTNTLQVVDANGYQVSDINKVTIGTESKTEIKAGAYTLNYSVDSTRRENNAYLVFTYFKLTPKNLAECANVVTFMDASGKQVTTQNVDKVNGSRLLSSSILNLDGNSKFLGWTKTKDSSTIDYKDQAVVKEQVTLYPVIKKNHEVVYLSEITFDSLNSEVQIAITDVKEIKSVTYSGTNYLATSYISASKNIITINEELFELFGYVDGGQVYTVTFVSEDGSESSTTFKIEYPNFVGDAI